MHEALRRWKDVLATGGSLPQFTVAQSQRSNSSRLQSVSGLLPCRVHAGCWLHKARSCAPSPISDIRRKARGASQRAVRPCRALAVTCIIPPPPREHHGGAGAVQDKVYVGPAPQQARQRSPGRARPPELLAPEVRRRRPARWQLCATAESFAAHHRLLIIACVAGRLVAAAVQPDACPHWSVCCWPASPLPAALPRLACPSCLLPWHRRYNDDLEGVMLSYSNARLLTRQASIHPYFAFVRVEVAVDGVLFHPKAGMRLGAERAAGACRHASCVPFECFRSLSGFPLSQERRILPVLCCIWRCLCGARPGAWLCCLAARHRCPCLLPS